MIGQTVSHYRILERLGEGGMGVVYKAQDTHLDRPVALKFLPPHLGTDKDARARFIQEAKSASSLEHTNICAVYDIDETEDGRLFLAMSCYEGESLKDKIERGPLPVEEAVNYAIQIAQGLAKAHKKDIIHRDIKPGNIMVTNEGVVKIVDFGLAKMAETSLTKTGRTLGTAMYMSPEQGRGEKVDLRTDIWSVGVILYEMLTGKQPFRADYEQAVMYMLMSTDPEPITTLRPDVPASLVSVVSRLMQKDPKDRYADMGALLTELQSVQQTLTAVNKVKEKPEPSIAVLAFTNMSADPEQEYFCDGMAEEIINALTQVRGLKIIARTSAFYFKGKDVKISEIGRQLDVETVLEGSVRKAGNRLRITAQLINVADSTHLWSQRYDRQLEDVFEIQDEISMAIVDRLKVELLGEQREGLIGQPTENTEAYTLYLKGRFFREKLSPVDMQQAVSCYQQAIDLDPGFARAYAGIANTYALMTPAVGIDVLSRDKAYTLAKAAVTKALALDDRLALAHAVQGFICTLYEWDWEGAEQAFKRALALNPNDAMILGMYSRYLMYLSRFDESLAAACRAESFDPLSLIHKYSIGVTYFYTGIYEKAIFQFEQILEMDPHYIMALHFIGWAYYMTGLYDLSYKYFQRMLNLIGREPVVLLNFASLYTAWSKREKALKHLEELKALSEKRYVAPGYFSYIYYFLKDQEEAFNYMERACEERDSSIMVFLIGPRPTAPKEAIAWRNNFHSHPRVQAIKKKVWPEKK